MAEGEPWVVPLAAEPWTSHRRDPALPVPCRGEAIASAPLPSETMSDERALAEETLGMTDCVVSRKRTWCDEWGDEAAACAEARKDLAVEG